MSDPPAPARGIDRAARDDLIRLTRELVAGERFVEDFQADLFELMGKSSDRAVTELGSEMDGLYSDLHNHKLTGRYAVKGERLEIVERCLLFLSTDLAYEWPDWPEDPPSVGCGSCLGVPLLFLGMVLTGFLAIVNLGHSLTIAAGWCVFFLLLLVPFSFRIRKLKKVEQDREGQFQAAGDFEVFPFLRRADYERALRERGARGA